MLIQHAAANLFEQPLRARFITERECMDPTVYDRVVLEAVDHDAVVV